MDVERFLPLEHLPALESAIAREVGRSQGKWNADGQSWTRRRDAMACALGLHGMRVGEVVRAKRHELLAFKSSLIVPPFKRGNRRVLQLHGSLVDEFKRFVEDSPPSDFLLPTRTGAKLDKHLPQRASYRFFHELLCPPNAGEAIRFQRTAGKISKITHPCLHAGVLTFHSFRHTCATRILSISRDVYLVKNVLGHKSLTSTEKYLANLAPVPDECLVRVLPALQTTPQLRVVG